MRKIVIKRLLLFAIASLCGIYSIAQTITIDNTNLSAGPYGRGGGITVPIKLSGACINTNNTFQLYLSDAAGNFPGTLIGTYTGFFTPFINGVIPAGTTTGANYKVRVVSTSPAVTSASSNTFSIVATTATPVTNPTTSPTNTINDTTFGRCLISSNQTISLGVSVPAGNTLVGKVLDSLGINVTATVTAAAIQFTMVPGNYYTVQVSIKNTGDNSISIKSYLVLASTTNLSLQTSGSNEICLPDEKAYTINASAVGGIKNNYPGTTYTIAWGDGNTDTYTHCQLIGRDGEIKHTYTQTSCGRPAITDITPPQYNAFKVNVTAANTFCPNSFTPITTYAKVWEKPEANFTTTAYGCINTNILFPNTSVAGLSGANNAINCTSNTVYEWYVDGLYVSGATNLTHQFSTTGMHTIRLVAISDPCSDDTTKEICIEPTPVPDFTLNGQTSLTGCAPAVVNVANNTNSNPCRPFTWNWQVLLSPSLSAATLGFHYTITPSATDSIPQITFMLPGTYIVRLSITNSCGTFTKDRTVTLLLDADVTLPGNQQYCNLQTINFQTAAGHIPTYNTNSGTLSYLWTITGGSFSYVSGTSATSQYPQVQFASYGTYTVKVKFTNDCGVDSATQLITFYEPVTSNAGADQIVCYSVNSVNLSGASTGPSGYSAAWSIQPGFGSGSFSNANTPNPTYTFSAGDKTSGTVRLIYTATPPIGSACPVVRDTIVITIRPDNSVTSAATKTICSGSSVAYTINATLAGSTFSWTSSVISGTATGNSASGTSATISDVLTNTSNSVNAVVRYVITPIANSCNGNSFNFDVTVKPLPDLTATPSATTLCSGSQLTITLTSALAGVQYTWTSTPSGGTVTGNSNQASPISTTSIVNNPLINTGTTDVTLTYNIVSYNTGSPVCTGQSQQVIVTIKPPVNASASSNSPICSGQTINLTGGSTTAGVSYSWTGPNGFTSSIQSPSITNAIPVNAGVYTLITTSGSCNSSLATTTVVVNTSATIALGSTQNPSSCASATGNIVLSGLANNTQYSISYTYNGGSPITLSITSSGTGTVTIPNLASGIYNNIMATINGCGSNAIGPITLSDPNPPATPTTGSNSPICSGLTLNLTANTTSSGATTWAWSGPNSFSSSSQNPSINNATVAATGTYNVTVTINNCTSAAGVVSVVVNQTPATPIANNNGPVCTDATLNLTSNSTTPGVSYAWIGPNSFTSSSQNPSITTVTTAATGTYSVTATLGSCTSATGTTTVVLNQTPNISGTAKTDPTNCASATGSIILSGLTPSVSYSVTYTLGGNPQGPVNISTNGLGLLTIPNLAAGVYDNIRVTRSGCQSNLAGPITLVDPTPPNAPTANSNAPLCSGLTLNLTVSTSSPGTATYTWSGPNGFSSTTQNPSITNVTIASTGTYSVTATINSCTSPAGTVNVLINQTPITPTAGSNSPVCSNGTLNLTSTTSTGGVSYAWAGPNTFTSGIQNPSISNVTAAASGTYNVTATLGSCTSAAGSTTVVVNPTPNISGSSSTNPTNCATSTGSIILNGLTASTSYTVHYTQGATPVTVVVSSNGSGNLTIANLPAGVYTNVSVELVNCPSNSVGPFTLVDPTPPAAPVAGSNSPICSGNNLLLTANSVTPGVTYNWSGPSGYSSTTQNPTINNAPITAAGTYSVTATLNSCTSSAGTTIVVIHPTPVTPTAGSNTPVCTGNTLNLTSSTPSGGVTYAWTGPNAFSNTQQNPSISNVTTAAAGTYSVIATATLGTCPSATGTTTVVINPTPNISGSSSSNPTNCASSTGSITLTGLTASTAYTVKYTQGATPQTTTIVSDGSGAVVILNLPAGTYTNVSVTLNNCPSNVVGPFTLVDPTPPATPVAGSNSPVCSGNTLNLTATTTSPGTATWAWSGPNSFSSTTQNPNITNVPVVATGTYNVTVTINSCTSPAGTVSVVINQTPATPVVTSNTPVCSDSTLNLGATTSTPGIVTWTWTGPNGFTSIVQNPSITSVTTAASGTYNVVATATVGNCPSAPGSGTVVINPTPIITTTSFTDPTNCNTATGTIILNGLTASTSYTVLYDKNGNSQSATLTTNGSGTLTIPNLTAGVYTNVRVVLTGCPSNVVGPFTLTDPNPPAAPTAGSNSPICSGNTLNLTASTTSVGTITYTWSGPNSFSSTTQNPSIASSTVAATGTYSVTATLNSCVSAAGTVAVTVHQTPATPVAGSNSPVCSDSTLNLTASTTFAGAVTWTWSGPNSFASSSQNPSIASVTTAANGTYNVVATSTVGTCPSAAGSTTVLINPTPVIISSSFTNPTQCFSSTGTIILNGLTASTTYTVTYTKNGTPVTASITSNGGGVVTILNLPAATYANIRVTTLAGCPSNSVGPYILSDPNPPATPVAGSNSPICNGNTLTLTASTTTVGAIVYSWTGPNAFTSNVQNPSIVGATTAASGWYYVTATLSNCTSLRDSVLVDVNGLPAAPIVTTPVNYCVNTPSVPLTATPLPGNSLLWYSSAVGGTGSTIAPTPSTAVVGSTPFYVSQISPLGCQGTRALITVIINPDARAEYVYAPDTACAPFNINSSVIQPVLYPAQNATYQWFANGTSIGVGTTFPGYIINLAGDSIRIKLTTVSPFGCKSDSTAHWFFTFPKPATNFTASDTVGCGPLSVAFTNTTPLITRFSYLWDFGTGAMSNQANPGTIIFPPNPTAGDTIYHVTLTAFTQCDTVKKTIDIRVKSKPRSFFTPDKTYGCSPLTVSFVNNSFGVNMSFVWDFGDGSPTVTMNNTSPVQHTFNTAQQDTFYVKLIASNACGGDTATYAIVVAARTIDLNFAVNGNERTGCSPHTVRFINNSVGATNFLWNFGDGNVRSTTKNIDTVVHTYTAVGNFTAIVRASNGCTDTTGSITIQVFKKPIVDFAVNPLPACLGDTLNFTNQTDTATNLLWQFGNGVTSQLTNPQYAYTIAGTYNVKLIAVRQYGPGNSCSDSIIKPVTVVASLPGSFSVSDSVSACVPFSVIFTNHSLPSTLTTWNFGDGGVDTGDIVSHTFQNVGIFTVSMIAKDAGGCSYIATKKITVNGPAGAFIYDHGFICGNTPVRFEANVTNTDSIRWNFGDGVTLTTTQTIVYHVYNQSGSYIPTAQLLAGPGGTCRRLLTGIDTIKIDKIKAGFTAAVNRICGSTTVVFTDTSRAGFALQSWQWSFGDGGTSGIRNPQHSYTATNTWNVRLIVNSASGCADTANIPMNIKVDSKPTASINAPPTGCVNQPVQYDAIVTSADPVTFLSWTFSNGGSGLGATVQQVYSLAGTYTARLIAGTSFGCFDTAYRNVTVNPTPTVITNPDMVLCKGQSTPLSATGGLTYQWSPIAGLSCNTCFNPIASPTTTTQYVVSGYNSFGCAGRDTLLITVPQPIGVVTAPVLSICIGQSIRLSATGATTYEWSPSTGLDQTNIANPTATPLVTTIYRVIGKDAYNCFQDTAYVTVGVGQYPVVNVGADKVLATGTTFTLTPTASNGPIALWNWSPITDLSCGNCPNPIVTAKTDICYTVTATNLFGCAGKDTMCIKVFCESSQVFIPNAFTPDGDGVNDILTVRAKGVKLVKSFRVFNRWGQVVFEKANFVPNVDGQGWNGKVNNVPAPPDVYVYTCEVICENDVPFTYKGNTAILK
jgi:gliding motility-associated-like protein